MESTSRKARGASLFVYYNIEKRKSKEESALVITFLSCLRTPDTRMRLSDRLVRFCSIMRHAAKSLNFYSLNC